MFAAAARTGRAVTEAQDGSNGAGKRIIMREKHANLAIDPNCCCLCHEMTLQIIRARVLASL